MNLFKAAVFDMDVTLWDVGGSMRGIWAQYYDEADGVIFCVDAADGARFGEAARALDAILAATAGPVLVLANKQDLPAAAPAAAVQAAVCAPAGLAPGGRRAVRIVEISAVRGGAVRDAVEWIVSRVERSG
jgi:signal recognition particle receptor subunit beta